MPREEAIVTDLEQLMDGTPIDLPPETAQEGALEDINQPVSTPEDMREVEETEEDIEIEVIDDTPEDDQGRTPLPEDIKKKLEEEDDDELDNLSSRTKQRIAQLKKAWHDERREREASQRQLNETLEMARRQMSQAEMMRQQLQQGEEWALERAKHAADLELQTAQQKYKEAYESGDSDAFAQASSELARATSVKQQADAMLPQYQNLPPFLPEQGLQQPETGQYYQQEQPVTPPPVDDRTKAWAEKNSWFGTDPEKTSFALGVHQRLVDEGISPQTDPDKYYERLDARINEVFGAPKAKRPSTVVAGAKRTPSSGKKVVLSQSQLAVARKLGITPQAYAKELLREQERNNG